MAQLQDLENELLLLLQQPGSNPGGAPTWGSLTNPPYNQATIDFAINRGYERLCADLNQYEIADQVFTITSVANTYIYPYNPPPAGQAPISLVHRLFYAPIGQNYTWEYKPGYDLVSWDEYQKITNQGYLQLIAATSTLPQMATLDPLRQNIYFYPGSANSGDIISVQYAALPQAATDVPILSGETDVPIFPQDCHQAIVFYAMFFLMWRQREAGGGSYWKELYDAELGRLQKNYNSSHRGDITRFDLWTWQSYPYPWGGAYP